MLDSLAIVYTGSSTGRGKSLSHTELNGHSLLGRTLTKLLEALDDSEIYTGEAVRRRRSDGSDKRNFIRIFICNLATANTYAYFLM